MSSSYRKTIEKLAQAAGEGDRRPCKRCDTPTAIATLSQYGGRCFGCFEAFCGAAFSPAPPGYDTVQQAELRKRLRDDRPVGQAMARGKELDAAEREAAKAATARRVAEYARQHGVAVESDTRVRDFGARA